jgi:hypothetical protein
MPNKLKVYVAHKNIQIQNEKHIFILARPFLRNKIWGINSENSIKYNLLDNNLKFVLNVSEANIILLPFSINYYFNTNQKHLLVEVNSLCQENGIFAYGYISGDLGIAFKEFSNIIYFRLGGFKNQLSNKNKGFPVALSDHFKRIYQKENIIPTKKNEKPIVGFCGQASTSLKIQLKSFAHITFENSKRFIKKPFRRDYEPLFAPSIERAKILKILEKSKSINTNFILRNKYRAGAKSIEQREKTTLEYYDNILQSDYIVCIRGAGNFSVRFYETLLMGKIPIFVNTNCLLPFEDKIIWKNHVVWLEWNERKNIANIVADFHANLSEEQFKQIQINNRKLWKETLSIKGMLEIINNDI